MPPAKGKKAAIVSDKTIEAPVDAGPATPQGSPSNQQLAITAAQKQALMDNLQLEITERARKLRATYALHTQGLRSRLEMRINRIPQPLRSVNIMELVEKYADSLEPPKTQVKPLLAKLLPDPPMLTAGSTSRPTTATSSPPARGLKRSSDHFTSDKENMNADLDNPKKRSRIAAAPAAARAVRAVSRKLNPASVLSPKSHNSRTTPQSPARPMPSSPAKLTLGRPASPAKSSASTAPTGGTAVSTAATRTKAAGRGTSKQTATKPNYAANTGTVRVKRAAAAPSESKQPRSSDESQGSEFSNGSTIVTKKTIASKGGIVSKMSGRKATTKKEPEPTAAAGRSTRTLRSRK